MEEENILLSRDFGQAEHVELHLLCGMEEWLSMEVAVLTPIGKRNKESEELEKLQGLKKESKYWW